MTPQELARKLADGEPIDWEVIDTSDPLMTGLRKIARFFEEADERTGSTPRNAGAKGDTWGNLQLVESIGRGSYGEVFRAFDPMLQRDVALKVVRNPAECLLDSDDFIAEAQRLAQVRHRNVMAVYGAAYQGGTVGFWCELLIGETLDMALSEDRKFAWPASLEIMHELAMALVAVHQAGIVHGDIKPANVMLEPERGAVLLDFGAGLNAGPGSRLLGFRQGTPMVMAPELFEGQELSQASDVYALGVLFYRLVVGRFPVKAETLEDLQSRSKRRVPIDRRTVSGCPRGFRALLREMLEPAPDRRIDAPEVLRRIEWLQALPGRRRKRLVAGSIAGLLLGITAASVTGYWFAARAERQMVEAQQETLSVNSVLTNMLASASPLNDGKDVRVVDVLSNAEVELRQNARLTAQVRSRSLLTLASAYLALRELDDAERILDEQLQEIGPSGNAEREWEIRSRRAQVYIAQRDWPGAIAESQKALSLATMLDPEGERVLDSEITLAAAHAEHSEPEMALARLTQALQRFPGAGPDQVGRAHQVMGRLYEQQGRPLEAQAQYESAAEAFYSVNGAYNINTIGAKAAVASVLGQQGRGPEAAAMLREQLDIASEYLGMDHKTTFNIRMNLGAVLADFGETDASLEIQRGVYESSRAAFGEDGLQTLIVRGNIATLLVRQSKTTEAEAIYRSNIDLLRAAHPDEHNYRLIQVFNLAELLNELGRFGESRGLAIEGLAAAKEHLGEISIVGMELAESIARSDLGLGHATLAESGFADSVRSKTETLGPLHPLTLNAMVRQAEALQVLGRNEHARALLQTALEGRRSVFGEEHPETLAIEARLEQF